MRERTIKLTQFKSTATRRTLPLHETSVLREEMARFNTERVRAACQHSLSKGSLAHFNNSRHIRQALQPTDCLFASIESLLAYTSISRNYVKRSTTQWHPNQEWITNRIVQESMNIQPLTQGNISRWQGLSYNNVGVYSSEFERCTFTNRLILKAVSISTNLIVYAMSVASASIREWIIKSVDSF